MVTGIINVVDCTKCVDCGCEGESCVSEEPVITMMVDPSGEGQGSGGGVGPCTTPEGCGGGGQVDGDGGGGPGPTLPTCNDCVNWGCPTGATYSPYCKFCGSLSLQLLQCLWMHRSNLEYPRLLHFLHRLHTVIRL
jgi:hypothetical protein